MKRGDASGGGGHGRGSPRWFTLSDLLAFALLADVLRAGVRASAVAPALHLVQRGHHLPSFEQLEKTAVWTDGRDAHLVRGGELPARRSRSASVSYLLHLAGAVKRLRAELHENHIAI